MADAKAHAIELFNRTWELLEAERTADDDEAMVNAAHASLHHWTEAGGPVQRVRGDWLVSRVYCALGRAEPAMHHARLALAVCEAEGIGDFDLAYALEGVARAAGVGGDGATAAAYRARAQEVGAAIADAEDRAQFESDLATL